MPLTSTDWLVIIGYLLANLLIGVYYRRRASGNTEEFFISGRDVSWWLAGTSMVATTFAADTPLLVTGLVARLLSKHPHLTPYQVKAVLRAIAENAEA